MPKKLSRVYELFVTAAPFAHDPKVHEDIGFIVVILHEGHTIEQLVRQLPGGGMGDIPLPGRDWSGDPPLNANIASLGFAAGDSFMLRNGIEWRVAVNDIRQEKWAKLDDPISYGQHFYWKYLQYVCREAHRRDERPLTTKEPVYRLDIRYCSTHPGSQSRLATWLYAYHRGMPTLEDVRRAVDKFSKGRLPAGELSMTVATTLGLQRFDHAEWDRWGDLRIDHIPYLPKEWVVPDKGVVEACVIACGLGKKAKPDGWITVHVYDTSTWKEESFPVYELEASVPTWAFEYDTTVCERIGRIRVEAIGSTYLGNLADAIPGLYSLDVKRVCLRGRTLRRQEDSTLDSLRLEPGDTFRIEKGFPWTIVVLAIRQTNVPLAENLAIDLSGLDRELLEEAEYQEKRWQQGRSGREDEKSKASNRVNRVTASSMISRSPSRGPGRKKLTGATSTIGAPRSAIYTARSNRSTGASSLPGPGVLFLTRRTAFWSATCGTKRSGSESVSMN